MGWEWRGSYGPYYIRKHRVNGQVIRQSYGRGLAAVQAAMEDAQRRAVHQQEWERRQYMAHLDADVGVLDQTITILMKAQLLLAGYHQHHRSEWRRKSNG
jgi:hypothetical protein